MFLHCFRVLGWMMVVFLQGTGAAPDTSSCRLWLAPSYLSSPERVRLGLYAGVDFQPNDLIPNPDIGIPIVDVAADHYRGEDLYALHRDVIAYLENIVWVGSFAGAAWEGNHSSIVFTPGLGTLANHHTGMHNVDWVEGSVLLRSNDGVEQPGQPSPGRGAYTDYYNMTMKAIRYIPAGMELYANFGDVWDSPHDDVYQERLTGAHYAEADKVLDHIIAFMDKYGDQMPGTLEEEVLDFMLETILNAAGGKRAKIIRSLLPPVSSKLRKMKEMGGSFMYRNRDIVKSQDWLEQRGLCLDNLQSGKSTIPDAGRGAFAKRSFQEGDIIAPVPMIPIIHEELLEMYKIVEMHFENDQVALQYDREQPIGNQLLMNYAFGHAESNLLLIPASPMVALVNHASEPNAYMTWLTHDYIENDVSMQDVPLNRWSLDKDPLLVMALVASRDIAEGEEIFINYGPAWESAWNQHTKLFAKAMGDKPWPLKAKDIRDDYRNNKKPYAVDFKPSDMPYPPNVFTACFIETDHVRDGHPRHNEAGYEIFAWVGPKSFESYTGINMLVCDLQSRTYDEEEEGYTYTVWTRFKDSPDIVEVVGVPHAAIVLLDKPYTSDAHFLGAFRHWIAIENERFPQAWRNLR